MLVWAAAMRLLPALFSGCRTDNYKKYKVSAECSLGGKTQQADILSCKHRKISSVRLVSGSVGMIARKHSTQLFNR